MGSLCIWQPGSWRQESMSASWAWRVAYQRFASWEWMWELISALRSDAMTIGGDDGGRAGGTHGGGGDGGSERGGECGVGGRGDGDHGDGDGGKGGGEGGVLATGRTIGCVSDMAAEGCGAGLEPGDVGSGEAGGASEDGRPGA